MEKVQYSTNLADIHYIRQKEPKDLVNVVWCASNFIGDETFSFLLVDYIVQSDIPC